MPSNSVTLADLILQVVRDPDFPKRNREARESLFCRTPLLAISQLRRALRVIFAPENVRESNVPITSFVMSSGLNVPADIKAALEITLAQSVKRRFPIDRTRFSIILPSVYFLRNVCM